jgi:hypothetical protein
MVEMFTKRSELMPSDESIDQHTQKRGEEIAEVDRDRNGASGLFKGAFPANGGQNRLFRDEQDAVWRCPGCHHEHEGGGHTSAKHISKSIANFCRTLLPKLWLRDGYGG